jgi:ankyrin repeat protein
MKRLVLNILCWLETGNNILPLFLRDAGVYYWNRKTFILQYGLDMKKCVENELGRTFRFFNPDKLFLESAEQGNVKILKYSIGRGADLQGLKDGASHIASIHGHIELVKYLIQNGIKNIWSVCRACRHGHLEVVKYLLENGAETRTQYFDALSTASQHGHLEVVKLLVENGGDIHFNNDEALRLAFENGHLEVVKYLLENGADTKKIN